MMRVAVAAVLLGAICASANPRHLLDDTVKVHLTPLPLAGPATMQVIVLLPADHALQASLGTAHARQAYFVDGTVQPRHLCYHAQVVVLHVQMNGAASIASGYINPMTVHNAIFGFAQAPKEGRHLLDDTVKVTFDLGHK